MKTSLFLCAPIELTPDFSGLFCVGSKHLELSTEESHEIIDHCNVYFKDQKLQLVYVSNQTWTLETQYPVSVKMTPLNNITGQYINQYLPQGRDEQRWCQLLTDTQLLLAEHPVNVARRKKGLSEINSLWFWQEKPSFLKKLCHFF